MQTWKLTLAMMALGTGAVAQEKKYNGEGYGYFAAGGNGGAAQLGFGAGAVGLVYKGLGVGADVGWVHPARDVNEGFGLLSVNPSWHFVNRDRPAKVTPFVTAGYTLGFRSGAASLWNWGGGATIWMTDRVGLRLEMRDYLYEGSHLHAAFRIGLSFR